MTANNQQKRHERTKISKHLNWKAQARLRSKDLFYGVVERGIALAS